jgi:hypothetical protein
MLVRGVLIGMGRTAECELIASTSLAAKSVQSVYSDCSIVNAPLDLPDGKYIAYFERHSIPANRAHGIEISQWEALG